MHTNSLGQAMIRYLGAIAPVYVVAAFAAAIAGLLVVGFIAHPFVVVGFVFGGAAGALVDHFARRLASFAKSIRTSYAGIIETAHNG